MGFILIDLVRNIELCLKTPFEISEGVFFDFLIQSIDTVKSSTIKVDSAPFPPRLSSWFFFGFVEGGFRQSIEAEKESVY